MNEFIVDIIKDKYLIDIQSSDINADDPYVDQGSIEISINNNYSLILESSIVENINNIEVQRYNDYNLILTNTSYADLPEQIPMSIITGNLHVSRIDGLDDYLSTIPLDGGTP